ncbi:MAG: hypothetical protein RB294_02950, partial [Bacteroidales bacterium]|nr:hypothetical protein [Bacteroidales bacterium]
AVTSLETEINLEAQPQNLERNQEEGLITSGELSFSSYEHSIESMDYRYEPWTSNKSEFAVNLVRIDENGTMHKLNQYMGWNLGTKIISQISKNDIGDMQYVWSHHADNWEPWSNPWIPNVTQSGVNMVFWNTFERDWNRSQKGLGTVTASGSTAILKGNMKYSSEWYAWIPETVQVHYTRFDWIYYDWAHWNNSWKSKFRLWRVGS